MPPQADASVSAEETRLSGDEALALLKRAENDVRVGKVDTAHHGFETLIASGKFVEWAHFFLGRSYRALGRHDAAHGAFDAAVSAAPDMFWAHYERLTLAHQRDGSAEQLAKYADSIARVGWEPLEEAHVRAIEPIAHLLWDGGRKDLAAALLHPLWPSPALGELALTRIVEAKRDERVSKEAMKRLITHEALDEHALKVLADHHQQSGDLDSEIAMLERRHALAPKDFQTWLSLVRGKARKGDRGIVDAALEGGANFPPRQRSFVKLIADLELGDLDATFLGFRNQARLYREVPKFPGIRLAYLFGDAFDTARRDEVIGLVTAAFPDDRDVALVRINAAVRDQRWDDARMLFETTFAGVTDKPQSVRLTEVDILAFSGRLDEAAALLERERVDGVCPPAFLRSTLRILSELNRWGEAFDVGLASLGEDASFEHFLSVMVRAARKTDRSADLFGGLLALPGTLKKSQLECLFAVAEDLAEQGHGDVLDRLGDLPLPIERRHRIRLKLRVSQGAVAPPRDLCIYYCADANYLTPALVSLTALAMSNISITRRAVFHLVVDSDVVPLATEAGGAIAARLGLALKVVDAAAIVTSADRLRTSYGLFTGGQQLALAAYYRIFFARHLIETADFSQAIYVDADTVVRGGLEELVAHDDPAPLLARYEIERPEVRHASEIHQLKGRYFNSGVLRFDLKHPELAGLLDKAIAAAIDPEINLIFQDQCALNIAFDTRMSELPERFNYFNPPTRSGDGIPASEAVIVHFLDRPKPWDSLYRQRAREWFEWFDLVETLRQTGSEPPVETGAHGRGGEIE